MFVGYAHGIGGAQRAGNDIRRIAAHFADEIRDQLNVEIGRIGGRARLFRKPKAEQIESKDRKVLRQNIKVLAPHETRRAGADAMNKHEWRPGVFPAGSFVEDSAILPIKEVCLAAKGAVIRLAGLTPNSSVDSGQGGNAGAACQNRLPKIA